MIPVADEALAPVFVGYLHGFRLDPVVSVVETLPAGTKLYAAPPAVAALIAEREAQLFEARQVIIKEGLARDAAEKRVEELEEKLMVLLAIQRKILASETAPATPAPATATSGHLR